MIGNVALRFGGDSHSSNLHSKNGGPSSTLIGKILTTYTKDADVVRQLFESPIGPTGSIPVIIAIADAIDAPLCRHRTTAHERFMAVADGISADVLYMFSTTHCVANQQPRGCRRASMCPIFPSVFAV